MLQTSALDLSLRGLIGSRRSDLDLCRLTPESWKSARGQKVSQSSAMDLGPRMSNLDLIRLALQSCKSSIGQNLTQTIELERGWMNEDIRFLFKTFLVTNV